jgi:hypothetical protein
VEKIKELGRKVPPQPVGQSLIKELTWNKSWPVQAEAEPVQAEAEAEAEVAPSLTPQSVEFSAMGQAAAKSSTPLCDAAARGDAYHTGTWLQVRFAGVCRRLISQQPS